MENKFLPAMSANLIFHGWAFGENLREIKHFFFHIWNLLFSLLKDP
jgi:hypothetical protein